MNYHVTATENMESLPLQDRASTGARLSTFLRAQQTHNTRVKHERQLQTSVDNNWFTVVFQRTQRADGFTGRLGTQGGICGNSLSRHFL